MGKSIQFIWVNVTCSSTVFQILEEENKSLTTKVQELQNLLQNHQTSQDKETQEVLQLHSHLGSKITELYEFHEQIVSTLRKESNS